jgi:glycylpeptide N-tetradecanoyltransferase
MPPGFLIDWHLGVRTTNNNKLVGFITAIPADIAVHGRHEKMVEINFLCVHKKIR